MVWLCGWDFGFWESQKMILKSLKRPFRNSVSHTQRCHTHTHTLQVGWFVEVLLIDLVLALRCPKFLQ